jgi:CDGSH-type Zn-finger protein
MYITGVRPKNKRISDRIALTSIRKEIFMGACQCGYTRDEEKNCDGTHKVVKAVKEDMAEKLAANEFPHAAEYVKNN